MGKSMQDRIFVVESLASEFAVDAEALRKNYSGRGMYGETCYGIVTDFPEELVERAVALGLVGACADSMGLSTIVYWKTVKQS